MTEDNSGEPDTTTVEIATQESLAALILSTTTINIGGQGFKIRPLSWKEDKTIDRAVETLRDETNISQPANNADKARERMRLIIKNGLMEPVLDRVAIDNLPSGMFIILATKIDDLSSFASKKE